MGEAGCSSYRGGSEWANSRECVVDCEERERERGGGIDLGDKKSPDIRSLEVGTFAK